MLSEMEKKTNRQYTRVGINKKLLAFRYELPANSQTSHLSLLSLCLQVTVQKSETFSKMYLKPNPLTKK